MAQAKIGDVVTVHYTGSLADGTVFDSSAEQRPLEITLGEERVLHSFEQALVGMSAGDLKTVTVSADQAYGPHDEAFVMTIGRRRLPGDLIPRVGQKLQMTTRDRQVIPFVVVAVSETAVTLDANHPLAGKDLTFEILLIDIA